MSDPDDVSAPARPRGVLGPASWNIGPEAQRHRRMPACEPGGGPHLSITYRIAMEALGETREAPATFTDLDRGVAACVAHARQHPGVPVRLFVRVNDSPIADHHYTVFEAQTPELAPFMRAGIRRQYGEEPPI